MESAKVFLLEIRILKVPDGPTIFEFLFFKLMMMMMWQWQRKLCVLVTAMLLPVIGSKCTRPKNLIGAYGDFGNWNLPINTTASDAQILFNQGLLLTFGFNQVEARENFKAALALDSECIMCYWGLALACAPNVNTHLNIHTQDMALQALSAATVLCRDAGRMTYECQLIEALRSRFPSKSVVRNWVLLKKDRMSFSLESMQPFAEHYASAMEELYIQYPSDTTIASLYAEAQLSCSPWKYYYAATANDDVTLLPLGRKAWEALEKVLAVEHHPLALHLWIHLTEQSDVHKYLAEEASFWIQRVVPASCHLVHMASHVYHRTGRYAEAILVNYKALDIHRHYYSRCLQPYGEYHDPATIVEPAMASGRSAVALKYSSKLNDPSTLQVTRMNAGAYPRLDMIVYARFGMWENILETRNTPQLLEPRDFVTVFWLYSQALAHAASRQLEQAIAMAARLRRLCDNAEFELNQSTQCKLAHLTVSARFAIQVESNVEKAIEYLKEAVKLEDAAPFNEPRLWYLPMRQCLGAAYLYANDASRALSVFERDLIQNPNNIWSLQGQSKAMKMLEDEDAAIPEAIVRRATQQLQSASLVLDVPIHTACNELFSTITTNVIYK